MAATKRDFYKRIISIRTHKELKTPSGGDVSRGTSTWMFRVLVRHVLSKSFQGMLDNAIGCDEATKINTECVKKKCRDCNDWLLSVPTPPCVQNHTVIVQDLEERVDREERTISALVPRRTALPLLQRPLVPLH